MATVALWPLLIVYMIINHHPAATPAVVTMPSWVPFWPGCALPYLGLLLSTWLLPMAIRRPPTFRVCLVMMICVHLLIMPWWVLAPTMLPRPPTPAEWWALPYRWLATHDLPSNITPCAHGIGPIMAAWFVGRERPVWRWPMALLLMISLPSIVLLWQHRPVDVALGMVAAGLGIFAGEALLCRRSLQEGRDHAL